MTKANMIEGVRLALGVDVEIVEEVYRAHEDEIKDNEDYFMDLVMAACDAQLELAAEQYFI